MEGDLGAGLRRAESRGGKVVLPAKPMSGPVVIPLSRERASWNKEASFYVGKVNVGNPPQELRVVFDTSSGDVLLPHRACRNRTCLAHRRYSPWMSSTAMDVDANGSLVKGIGKGLRLALGRHRRDVVSVSFTQSDLGEGEARAVIVRDTLCVNGEKGSEACVDMAIAAATSMDERPFGSMPCDGIVGLGLGQLSTGPLSSFLGRLFEGSRNVVPQFGIAFGADQGEVHLGGHDSARLSGPLRWFPVDHPEHGYWQVAIQAIRLGNVTVDDCKHGCHGVIDTGVSRLGVQADRIKVLKKAMVAGLSHEQRCQGPNLNFDLGGFSLTFEDTDYAGKDCAPDLGVLDLDGPKFVGIYAFGETLLRRYYAAFDWEHHKLGFAPLVRRMPSALIRTSHVLPDAMAGILMV